MRALRCLWLGDNLLTSLPRNIGQLNLTDWDNFGHHMFSTIIEGNPLKDPPMEVCRQGIRAIAQYFGTVTSSAATSTRSVSNDVTRERYNDVRGRDERQRDVSTRDHGSMEGWLERSDGRGLREREGGGMKTMAQIMSPERNPSNRNNYTNYR